MDQGVVEEWLSEFKVLLYCLCVRVRVCVCTQYAVRSLLSFFFFFKVFFWPFLSLLIVQLKSVTGNRVREGEWHAAKGPGPGSNPGPLQSLSMWIVCATDRAKRHPCYLLLNRFHPQTNKDFLKCSVHRELQARARALSDTWLMLEPRLGEVEQLGSRWDFHVWMCGDPLSAPLSEVDL